MPIDTDTGRKLTYADYVQIPEDGKRHEIIEGIQVVSPSPPISHQSALLRIVRQLVFLDDEGRATVLPAPVDVLPTEIDIVIPDVIAIAQRSRSIIGELNVTGPPQLVVEIHSPSTRRRDRGAKRALYESSGVLEYWMIDLEDESLTQLSAVEGRFVEQRHTAGRIESTAFPGFAIELAAIFA